MAAALTIESRVEALERELAEVKRRLSGTGNANQWLDRVAGSQSQEADFDEVLRLGRDARAADRPSDATGAE